MKFEIEAAPHLLAIVLIAGALGLGVWAYLTRYPILASRQRWVLLAARLLALFALLAASLAPVFRYPESSKARNRLLVLVDHSGSMDVRDAPGGRSRRSAADSVAGVVAKELGRRYDVRVAAFDAVLGPFGQDAARAAEGFPGRGETALGDAVRSALTRVDPDSVAALLLLSDGVVNRGEDPERALGATLPTFGLTVGNATDPPTVGIAGVEASPEMIVGRTMPIAVTVRQGARPPARGIVRVREEGRELGRAPFALAGPGASARVTIPAILMSRGKRFLTVELLDVTGDSMVENKRRLIAVEARPARRLVPVLAASWDWDLRSLSRGVEEDTTWGVVRLSPSGSVQVSRLGGPPASFPAILEEAEAVVARYDAGTITSERAALLMRYLERGRGVLFWIDPRLRPPPDSPLTRALGLSWRFWGQPVGPVATAELAPAGRTHEISLLGGDASSASATWKDLPPVEPLAALGTAKSPLQPVLLGRIGNETVPLLMAGPVGRGRVALLNAAGVYRWGLTASGIAGRAGVEASFFGGMCRWLAGVSAERAVRIAAPDISPEGRPIAVRLTSSLPPGGGTAADEARVTARPQGGGRSGAPVDVKLTALGGGPDGARSSEYSGAIALPPGTYLLQGRLVRGGRSIGSDSIRVAVGAQGIEYETLAASPSTLRRLAERSGGLAAPLDSAGPVFARLRSPDLARVRLAEMDLFHNPLLFIILIIALILEWTLRRRFHLM